MDHPQRACAQANLAIRAALVLDMHAHGLIWPFGQPKSLFLSLYVHPQFPHSSSMVVFM